MDQIEQKSSEEDNTAPDQSDTPTAISTQFLQNDSSAHSMSPSCGQTGDPPAKNKGRREISAAMTTRPMTTRLILLGALVIIVLASNLPGSIRAITAAIVAVLFILALPRVIGLRDQHQRRGISQIGLLQRLFPAEPVRQAIACLDDLRPIFESGWAPFGWDDIRNTARTTFLEDPDGVRRVAQKPGYDPRIACLRAVATVARRDLVSGSESLFPGRLTMQGDGKRAIYRIALAELVKVGALTAEDRIRCCRELDEDIREVG
jgi:hypothetical protein